MLCFVLVSELAASLEESRDELQVVKRKNTALIKVSVCCQQHCDEAGIHYVY